MSRQVVRGGNGCLFADIFRLLGGRACVGEGGREGEDVVVLGGEEKFKSRLVYSCGSFEIVGFVYSCGRVVL